MSVGSIDADGMKKVCTTKTRAATATPSAAKSTMTHSNAHRLRARLASPGVLVAVRTEPQEAAGLPRAGSGPTYSVQGLHALSPRHEGVRLATEGDVPWIAAPSQAGNQLLHPLVVGTEGSLSSTVRWA